MKILTYNPRHEHLEKTVKCDCGALFKSYIVNMVTCPNCHATESADSLFKKYIEEHSKIEK
jgi:hypothetical protein